MENPNVPIHPGAMLKEDYMDFNELDCAALAKKIGVQPAVIENLIGGRNPVDETLSAKLGKVMDIDEVYWMRLQKSYDLATDENEICLRNAMTKAGNLLTVEELDRRRIILSAFSAGKENERFDSIHSQKIMFFINMEVDLETRSRCFNFEKHLHGPVDHEFTKTLKAMAKENLIEIVDSGRDWRKRKYVLKPAGRRIGLSILERLPKESSKQIRDIVDSVMKLDFKKLKEATYKKYPNMEPSRK